MTLPLFETTRGVNFSFRFRSRLLSNSERRRPGTHSVRWSTCYNRSTDLGTVPRRSSCRNTSESEAWRNTCEKVLTVLSNRFVAGFPAIRPTSSNRSWRHEHSADERITSRPRKDEYDLPSLLVYLLSESPTLRPATSVSASILFVWYMGCSPGTPVREAARQHGVSTSHEVGRYRACDAIRVHSSGTRAATVSPPPLHRRRAPGRDRLPYPAIATSAVRTVGLRPALTQNTRCR